MQFELQTLPIEFGHQESLISLSQSAHEHLQSALKLRATLLQSNLATFHGHLEGIDYTIHQMTAYLNQISLYIPLPFHKQSSTQFLDIPTEVIEYICSLLPPRQVLKLRQLSKNFNHLLTSRQFAKLNLDIHSEPIDEFDHHQVQARGATELDLMFFHLPYSYQQLHLQRLKFRTSINWKLKLAGAKIPACIGSLSELVHLDLSYSSLIGSIPVELFHLTKLESLKLHENSLEGNVPKEIGNLENLKVLNLHSNRLSGEIPNELFKCLALTYLNLGYNRFEGNVPREIGSLVQLRQLYLSDCLLTGTIPTEIGALTNMQYLFLQNNQLVAPVPVEMANLVNLVACEMRGNKLGVLRH
ncbi:UNVERIFIED_CONTAM: hypothetical protein HDU68_011573 [Siphonaria sp. JEL0065]|nr:hypothetical protein HDU68_011573 [Siphonaria sp. JEL0065]